MNSKSVVRVGWVPKLGWPNQNRSNKRSKGVGVEIIKNYPWPQFKKKKGWVSLSLLLSVGKKKSSLKKKVKCFCDVKSKKKKLLNVFVTWNRVVFDFNVVQFMMWSKELNGEITIFSNFRYFKKIIWSFSVKK